MNNKTVLLTILDGWGIGDSCSLNAIKGAKTPNFDSLNNYPNTSLFADGGNMSGFLKEQMGD
ncbi:MAG: hypothetical protein MZU79_01945 [Anaerotruncus sp.]|nr:hypothetical protein [Anaerotruncus sp.]